MAKSFLKFLFGSQHDRDLKLLNPILKKINEKEDWAAGFGDEDFPRQTQALKERLVQGETLDDILPEAFALVREAARRALGERHYDVQLLGGIVLHQGKIMEMKTGEGKTLSSVTAAYLNSLEGKGVHVVTVNDYLAERDAGWMGPVYALLGVSVGVIVANMDNDARMEAYSRDITYGTNNEFGFDYLRDNMRWSLEGKVQKNHHYCIIDEIDSILIDEARTPLIISGQAEDDTAHFNRVNSLVHLLTECEKDPKTGEYPEEELKGDFKIDEKSKRISFTEEGMNHIEEILLKNRVIEDSLFTDDNFEFIHYFTQALKAHRLFHKDVDYVVTEGQVQIVDEFTGRILHGRRYSEGLHQAIEAKENIKVANRNRTLATITFQNFFRMYEKISGMTGTADTEAREFTSIYGLDVVVIPTNRPLIRKDEDDVIFLNEEFKYQAICDEIASAREKGQPILVGTVSIEKSELLSKMLTRRGIRHEVLNAKNHSREALIIAEAGAKGAVTIATNMAGRGTDIKLGGSPEFRARKKAGTGATIEEYRRVYDEEYKNWLKNYEEVKAAGGLYILGTERHESRRIDNQLRGRSGRQGDPGVSRFFLSLDDELMRLFARENLKNMMAKVGMASGEPLFHPWINKAIERAQNRVEERNFEIRKHLLEYDDVLNEQRRFIYSQRDSILEEEDLCLRVLSAAEEMVDNIFPEFRRRRNQNRDEAVVYLLETLHREFFYTPALTREELNEAPSEEIRSRILADLAGDLSQKKEQAGAANLNQLIRFEYLRNIDQRWQEHLEDLESLREAVYLRSYGQKNPLLEYKLEGFEIFDKLIANIKYNIARKILKVRIQRTDRGLRGPVHFSSSHASPLGFGGRSGGGEMAAARPQTATVVRTQPKVGRNDPCPCGSGKKYKHCHGA
ncbi:MAG: preprotein translocase subunit SecA [Spirochaetales bacterium]|jgi:preprotein translocase subunit SecA|nr:preprotein translocase subunit SecA [Spirochaetales bacterium]